MAAKILQQCLVLISAIMLVSCGGGSSSSQPDARAAAATATASTNAACTSITPFYWEIGNANGTLASGTGGTATIAFPSPPNPADGMSIASASKWLFSTYVVEKQSGSLSTSDIKFLNFESGYTNFNNCTTGSTVASCLAEQGTNGGTNGDYISSTDNHFYYDSGHMQQLASTIAIGLGADNNAALAAEIQSIIGTGTPFGYSQPQLAGGVYTSPAYYAQFLRNMLGGTRYPHMSTLLGSNPVCTHANSLDCPSALYSPINQSDPSKTTNDVSDEQWHYSLGHWVEDDPGVGDGAFSSPGRFGFYPWIDKTKTYYGILARYDYIISIPMPYFTSVSCGRLIRKAWVTGQQQ